MFSWSNLSDAFLLHVPTVFFFRMHHHRLVRSVCYRNRIQQLRCIKRHIGTSYFEARPEPGIRESPLPLFFVRGSEEYDWSKVINDFSAKGYGGVVVDLPPLVETVDDAVDYLENVKTKHGLVPPIMITFGLTTFVGQKYLESYSLRGLIMVNPIPPHNYEAALRRLDQSHAHKLVESLLAKKQNVLLEPGMLLPCPALDLPNTLPEEEVAEELLTLEDIPVLPPMLSPPHPFPTLTNVPCPALPCP